MFNFNVSGINSTFAAANKDVIQASIKAYSDATDPTIGQQTLPLFLTKAQIFDPNTDSTFISVNPYNNRLISSGFYKDLNKDKSVQKTLSKYYFYKIIDKWIYKELLPLLAFVDISSGKPRLIKSLEQYDVQKLAKDSDEDIEKKIEYMEKIIITKDMVRHVLRKICEENGINWYHLNKHERMIKKVFYNYLLGKLKESIGKYNRD